MRFDDCTMDHGRFIATTLLSMMRCLWWRLIVKLASTLDPWWNCSKVVSCCHHVGSHVSRQADWLPASEEPSRQHWWRDMVIWPRHGFNALMLVKMDMCRTSAGEVCRLRWRLTISILLGLPGWPFAREIERIMKLRTVMADETLFKWWKTNGIWSVLPYRPWNAAVFDTSAFCSVQIIKSRTWILPSWPYSQCCSTWVMKICDMVVWLWFGWKILIWTCEVCPFANIYLYNPEETQFLRWSWWECNLLDHVVFPRSLGQHFCGHVPSSCTTEDRKCMTRFLGDLDLSSTSRMSKADMQTPNIILYGGIALGLFLRVVAWLQDVCHHDNWWHLRKFIGQSKGIRESPLNWNGWEGQETMWWQQICHCVFAAGLCAVSSFWSGAKLVEDFLDRFQSVHVNRLL